MRHLEMRIDELEREMIEARTTFAILRDRLERQLGSKAEALLDTDAPSR